MPQPYDLPLEQLQTYRPPLTREADFDAFWQATLEQLAKVPTDATFEEIAYPANGGRVFRVTYAGFGAAQIAGWYAEPVQSSANEQVPGLVHFHGYNWSFEGGVHDVVNWALHGYAVLGMLCRGQQSSEDNLVSPHGHMSGWMTKGILDKETYYYRGVYMDAVRAIEVLASRANVDAKRIGVIGGSQGGGLSIASAALSDIPRVVVAEYPYLAHFRRAIDVAPVGPYLEINEFFRRNGDPAVEEAAMRTLSYHDIMNLAPRVKAPTLVASGLVDEITPPSTIFAAYNHIEAEKRICVYRYFGHEYIPRFHTERLQFLQKHLQA
jgi:cephalosporin-C deacetylase